jgi:hypothetical protein
MIPFEPVLLLWIAVSALLMADRNAARGLSIALFVGLLVLPTHMGIRIQKLPDLSKPDTIAIGVLLGTVLFHPTALIQFRPRLSDFLLAAMLACLVVTSVRNGWGTYDGLSHAFSWSLAFILPVSLARVHLATPEALRTFLTGLVLAAAVAAPFAVWEFRMSPQIHSTLYGEFQHQFLQTARWGFYRPCLCFSHPLSLGRFFAVATFLAALPLRRHLNSFLPYGSFLFLVPMTGLVLSMSYGPYLMFLVLCGLYLALRARKYLAYAGGASALLWLVLMFGGIQPARPLVPWVSKLSAQRAASFEYRLDAFDAYRENILKKPGFGHGGWGAGRILGRATDSQALIYSLARGLVGVALVYLWWVWALHDSINVAKALAGTQAASLALSVAAAIVVSVALSMVDAGLDGHVVYAAASMLALYAGVREGVFRAVPPALDQTGEYSFVRPIADNPPPVATRPVLRRAGRSNGAYKLSPSSSEESD